MEREENLTKTNRVLLDKKNDLAEKEIDCLERNAEQMCLKVKNVDNFENRIDIKMLLHNQVDGLLPLRVQYIDEMSICFYSVQGMISLEEMLRDKKADYFLIRKIYQGILTAQRKGQEYFLEECHFILEPSYLFWNKRKEQFEVCFFPGYKASLDEQLVALSQFLLKQIDHKDKKCVSFLYGIYEIIESGGGAVTDIAAYLKKIERRETKEQTEPREREKNERNGMKFGEQEQCIEKIRRENNHRKGRDKGKGRNSGTEAVIRLRNISNWKGLPGQVEINRDSFSIGRGQENHFVLPAAQVSYHHARIDRKQSQIYITDTGSSNGVSLNGRRLLSNHPVSCRDGDIIIFADIAYKLEIGQELG